jgi:hypothetical protein
VLAALFGAATIISDIAIQLNLQALHPSHEPVRRYSWEAVAASNCVVAAIFYLTGRARNRWLFCGILTVNAGVWAAALSLLVPLMRTSSDWVFASWLCGYITIEMFAYMLANSLGRCRLTQLLPVVVLLALAAYIESVGMSHFGRTHRSPAVRSLGVTLRLERQGPAA